MADHYRHAEAHPARDAADTLRLGLGAIATLTLATAFIGTIVCLGAGWPLLVAAFVGVGALATELYRAEDRRVHVDIQPAEEADR